MGHVFLTCPIFVFGNLIYNPISTYDMTDR